MRVNLISRPSGPATSGKGRTPIFLTIRPACGLPGDYQFPTDSDALMRMLRKETSLPATVLERFEDKLAAPTGARLLGVELGERILTDIGYFVD